MTTISTEVFGEYLFLFPVIVWSYFLHFTIAVIRRLSVEDLQIEDCGLIAVKRPVIFCRNISASSQKKSPLIQCSIVQAKIADPIVLVKYAAMIIQDFSVKIDTLVIETLKQFVYSLWKTQHTQQIHLNNSTTFVPEIILSPFMNALDPWKIVYIQYIFLTPMHFDLSLSRTALVGAPPMVPIRCLPKVDNVFPVVKNLIESIVPDYRSVALRLSEGLFSFIFVLVVFFCCHNRSCYFQVDL